MKPIASTRDLEHESCRFYALDQRYDFLDPEKATSDEDIRFFGSEARKCGGPVLEIGCGPSPDRTTANLLSARRNNTT